MRMREEECTCQVFAAVAVHTLSRSFGNCRERIRGVSQLELLYAEFAREEQQKQIRKEQKKIKRKRKRARFLKIAVAVNVLNMPECYLLNTL
ncbi:hypothetical protein NQ318_016246 [Aromia moschata]|uniref:Uncharacterized protein n=1 Tax=Aromia moschata TaxID=1265417 RepID=A0AAV8XZY0_9CUCU|nr:hypothetical protein NQ318_016246 [Aromia moschata]